MTTKVICDFPNCTNEMKQDISWTFMAPLTGVDFKNHEEYDICPEHAKIIKYIIKNGAKQ